MAARNEGGVMRQRFGRRRVLVVGVMALGLLAAVVGGALASHNFSDVSTGAFYHDDVSWLVANNVTAGCGSGKYCPDKAVTRGQMATFLHALAGQPKVGHFSCDAYGFQPANSTQTFSIGGGGATSNGALSCPVHIPDGSTITKFAASFLDNNAGNETCLLDRQDILVNLGSYNNMAGVATSGTPGSTRIVDTSVAFPVVDNNYYSYNVFCGMDVQAVNLTVFGVTIEYTYLGVPAP